MYSPVASLSLSLTSTLFIWAILASLGTKSKPFDRTVLPRFQNKSQSTLFQRVNQSQLCTQPLAAGPSAGGGVTQKLLPEWRFSMRNVHAAIMSRWQTSAPALISMPPPVATSMLTAKKGSNKKTTKRSNLEQFGKIYKLFGKKRIRPVLEDSPATVSCAQFRF